jgi:hypothetical protein
VPVRLGDQPLPQLDHQPALLGLVELPGPETAVFWLLSALRAHTKAPHNNNNDLLWKMLSTHAQTPLGGPGRIDPPAPLARAAAPWRAFRSMRRP